MNTDERESLRKAKIAERDSLSSEERLEFSDEISNKILNSDIYTNARVIMVYRAVKGEVSLDRFIEKAKEDGKILVYPLCISKTEMKALAPGDGDECWKKGAFGILEPIEEKSREVKPEEVDLVICPCTAFDENGGRMGMGAGYYDRFLERCVNAAFAAAAFQVQWAEKVPMEPWDKVMDYIFTEKFCFT